MVFIECGKSFKNILWLQWIAGMGALLMNFTLGLMMGWTSPYLAQLTAEDSPLQITTAEASWVASLLYPGRLLGSIFGCISIQYFGSKRTLVVIGLPVMLCWIFIILADSVIWLYMARISGGISLGIGISSAPLYLGEVASPMIRGTLVSLAISGSVLGVMVGNAIGSYISISLFSYIGMVPNVIFFLLFLWLPESPHYLVRIGKFEDAQKSLSRYNPHVDSTVEIESMIKFNTTSVMPTLRNQLREFNLPWNRRAGMIGLALYFFQQFSGVGALINYREIIFASAGMNIVSPATAVIIVNAFGVGGGWAAVYIADQFSRKALMTFSSAGVGMSMAVLGTHFALLDNGFNHNAMQWLVWATMIAFQCLLAIGLSVVPNMILSELFSPNIKSLAGLIAGISVGLFGFTVSKIFQPLVDTVGEAYVFWIHAILMVLSAIFAVFFLPETKGKSLQEIQASLTHK